MSESGIEEKWHGNNIEMNISEQTKQSFFEQLRGKKNCFFLIIKSKLIEVKKQKKNFFNHYSTILYMTFC
jgi:uncharacterized protein YwgA